MTSEILNNLNIEQQKPASVIDGPVLVTAGAGSGKTRMLTHRIAHMVKDLDIAPYHILAITFTNKAANEMKERLEKMLDNIDGMWVCTFHAMCSKILRQNIDLMGYSKSFSIYGDTEKNRVIKRIIENKIRADRLKFNIERQGARVNIMRQDARMLDDFFSFDKILLDAPCSGSGTENIFTDKFNEELITRSKDTQEKLLNKAVKVLRAGGELIYSTCSILKEENEDILNKVIKKYDLKIVEIEEMKRNTIFASYSEAEQFA